MTQPTAETTVRPRAAWYLVVVVLWVASAVLFGTAVASFIKVLDDGVTSMQASQSVPVPDSGITVYSRTEPQSRDCVMVSASGQSTEMDGLSFDLNATFDGTTVYAVATSPDGLAPGEYRISCAAVGGQLYYGDKLPLGSILVRTGISLVLGLVGLAVLVVLLVKRHSSKSRIRAEQLRSAPPGQGVGWPPGWTGGPPTTPYGQPPPGTPYGQPTPMQPYQPPPGYDAPPAPSPPPPQPPPASAEGDTDHRQP